MSRTVHCVVLNREAEGLDKPPYPGALGQRIQRFPGSMATMVATSNPAHQRIPLDADRPASAQIPGG